MPCMMVIVNETTRRNRIAHDELREVRKMSAKLIASVNSVSAVALNHAYDWYCASVRSNEPVEPKQMFDGRPWDPLT